MSGLEIGIAAALVGGSLLQGASEANALKKQAGMNDAVTAANVAAKRREVQLALGTQAAQYGAAGVEMSGSAVDQLAQSAAYGELDAQNILYQGNVASYNLRQQAKQVRQSSYINALGALGKSYMGSSIFGKTSKTTDNTMSYTSGSSSSGYKKIG